MKISAHSCPCEGRGGGIRVCVRHPVLKGPLPSIEERPEEVSLRTRIGDWGDDLVVSHATPDALKTLNERVSGIVFITRVLDHTILETNRVVQERMRMIPYSLRKTLTRDRGSENLGYRELEENLGIKLLLCQRAPPVGARIK